jgi:hypothetical protein
MILIIYIILVGDLFMLKKICSVLLISIITAALSLPVFALPDDEANPDVTVNINTEESVTEGAVNNESPPVEGEADKIEADKVEDNADKAAEGEDAKIAIEDIIADKYIESTGQFLVTITRPEGDESTFNKSYIICGVSSNIDVEVVLSVYNESSGKYEEYKTTEGVSRWKAGKLFTKEVILNEGANKIKLVAYNPAETDNLSVGDNVQVNKFTISVLKESLKDKIINGVVKITDIIENMITK